MADRCRTRRALRAPGPDIVRRQVVLEEHDLAPDGSFAIVSQRVVAGNGYASNLFLVPLPAVGSARRRARPMPRQLNRGASRGMRPAISPDWRRVAFTRRVAGSVDAALLVLDLDGGEPDRRPIALPVGEIAWSPDGRWIAFTAETDPHRLIVGPVPKTGEPLARRVTRLDWRYDETGYLAAAASSTSSRRRVITGSGA